MVRKAGNRRLQFRVFGRFAELNIFIVLTGPVDRLPIDYSSEIVQCQEKWRTLFGDQPPLNGRLEYDYISPNGVSLQGS